MPSGMTRTTLRHMTYFPPPAEELRFLDSELRQLDARRAQLLARRAWLITTLQQAVQPVPPVWPNGPTPPGPPSRPEATAPGVQNVLLVLGGVLLTIAAMVFTLVSWGHLGIAGRSLVLGAVTLAVLGAPVALLRRGLRSTAESVAGLGLALTVLDAYALYEVVFTAADGTTYAAAASTALAAVWAAYGTALAALPGPAALRLPHPAALAVAQLPLVLWTIALGGGPLTVTAAALLTAAFDAVLALRVTERPVRLVAVVCGFGTGGWGVLAAGLLSLGAAGPSAAARAAALLLLAAAIALGVARFAPRPELVTGTAATGALCLVAGLGGVLRVSVPGDWAVPGYLACGIALLAAVRGPEAVRRGVALASGAVQAGAVLWAAPAVGVTLLGPAAWLRHTWSGVPADARAAVTGDAHWPPYAVTVPLILAAVAVVLVTAVRSEQWRPRALTAALTLTWAAVLVAPTALQLPYTAALLIQGLMVSALLALTLTLKPVPVPVPAGRVAWPAAGLALLTSLSLALLSLAAEPATLAVLASLTAVFAVAAWRGRTAPVAAAASLAHATALACAVGASAGWRPEHIALLVLVVPVAAALVAARLDDSVTTVAVEVTGAVAALVAIGLAVVDPPLLALVLSLCAVIAAGTAVRSERRSVGYAAVVLFVLATWVRLAAWRVGLPEAYTLPVTVPALLVGALRRRRDPVASSWTAYGPGLTVTLLPSLATAWGDTEWTRPLLLGAAALLLTLLGARHRLRAPLVLGGSVLALDALHELGPYLVQVTDALPRWVPPALAGLLLLALGATYEQRLRDVRRVREVLGRMN
ncbi:SCO7613 C-terminal domain-containing membrane protein [Streptomyces sp. NPDC060000]|uniref:SCO7613 C-terminal domain-containing membrane protein n=1 Tax=Streptomyces sp. NPDC060000 TaxID=3347031 RepID=UPI00369073B1